jgi:pimeloyl-ACP methyl ester carboxylesterase
MRIWIRVISRLLLVCVVVYGSLVAYLYFCQEEIIFHPVKLKQSYVYGFDCDFEEINLDTKDGKRIHAIYFKTPDPKGVILFFHGNTGALHTCGNEALTYVELGYNVLMPDYRSFGKSGPGLSQENLLGDALLCYEYLLQENWKPSEISLIGRSLGTGMASYIASQKKISKLVLFTPYASMKQLAGEKYPFLPSFVLTYPLETKKWFKRIKCPVFIFHGTSDGTIPFAHSLQLAGINRRVKLFSLKKGKHNNLEDFALFHQKIAEIFE